jgi:glycosyltransferase involved in cell wall biosynthesis
VTGPVRILHLLDDSAGWQQRIGVNQLTGKLSADGFACRVLALHGQARNLLASSGVVPELLPQRFGASFFNAPQVRRYMADRAIDLAHTWSVPTAVTVAQATDDVRLVVELFDPVIPDREAAMLRSIQGRPGFGVACTSAAVRRRLIEKGLEPEACTVIRPGVDFATINAARQKGIRQLLGLAPNERALVVPEPATPGGGQFTAYWTAAIRSALQAGDHLILPGLSTEQARIERLARQIGFNRFLRCPGEAFPFEDLVANADVLLSPSRAEVSTTAVAWAMAAGVPVIASAVYATTELLSHERNALLLKPESPKRMAVKLAAMLDQADELRKVRDVARGQAYEIFDVRRYADQHARLYQNLLDNQSPGDGIVDPVVGS